MLSLWSADPWIWDRVHDTKADSWWRWDYRWHWNSSKSLILKWDFENHFNDYYNPIIRCLEFLFLLLQGDGLRGWIPKTQVESWHFPIFPGDSFCPSPGPKHFLKVQILFLWDWPLVVFSDYGPCRVGVKSDPCLSGSLQPEVSLFGVLQTLLDLLGTLGQWWWGCFQAREAKRRIIAFCHLSGFLASTSTKRCESFLTKKYSKLFVYFQQSLYWIFWPIIIPCLQPSLYIYWLSERGTGINNQRLIHSFSHLFPQ